MIEVTLPLPPSVNAMYKRGRGYGLYKSKEAKEWVTECLWLLKKNRKKFGGKVDVEIHFFFKRDSDIDNRIKPLLDLFQEAGVYKNDKQVYSIYVGKNLHKDEEPRVEVTIYEN